MGFTEELWAEIAPIYRAILEHPFNRELAEGTLSRERFSFYVRQDTLYLVDFGRALSLLGSRSPVPEHMLDFVTFSAGVFHVEQALHGKLFRTFRIRGPAGEKAPACFAYTNYLIATAAHRTYEEGVAAVLPCFWIYREVGRHIYDTTAAENPYRKWIDTYAGPEFSASVDKALIITEAVAAGASGAVRTLMKEAFVTSCRLEWMFWDGAYRMETWPPAV